MGTRHVAGCLLAASALWLACGGDDEPKPSGAPMARSQAQPAEDRAAENQAPIIERVVLQPSSPVPGQKVEARVDVSDPDGDPIRLQLEWRHDGRVISSGRATSMTPEGFAKGDRLEVIVTATDGRGDSTPVRVSATMGNRAPLVTALELAPDVEVQPGQQVTAVPQAMDPDGDELEFEFEWLLDGQPVGGDEPAFDTRAAKRGDRLQARVRVGDGEEWSPFAESPVLSLVNRPPRIAGVPEIESLDTGIVAQLEADDPDGDKSLRFRVIEGPKGLTVDPVNGRLAWKPEPGTRGSQPVEIGVADSYGAESALRFELTISAQDDKQPAPPAKAKSAADDGESEEDAELEADEPEQE